MTIDDTRINKAALVACLRNYRDDLRSYAPEDIADDEGNPAGDCRLQVHGGSWYFHTGDSSYDQDHRGYWGAASVSPDDSLDTLVSIADDLLSQCADHFCDSKID